MKTFIKCKACGFIMDASLLKDVCPACGLPKTVFEPYTKKISPNRKFIIDQHIHPISVHFPQVFIIVIMVMLSLALWVGSPLKEEFLIAAKLSILALPFSVLLALITGLIDAKFRFKKLTTPLLVNKIRAGITFLILSIAIFSLYLRSGFTTSSMVFIIVLSILSTVCAIFLGKTGATIFDSLLPG